MTHRLLLPADGYRGPLGTATTGNTVVSKASPRSFGPEFPCAPGMGDKCAKIVVPSSPGKSWGAPESPHPPDLWPPTGHSSCPTELLPPAHCRASVLYVHQAKDTIGKFCPRQDSHHHTPAQFSLTMLLSLGLKSLGFQVIINPNPSLLPAFLFPVIEMDRNFGDCFLLFL